MERVLADAAGRFDQFAQALTALTPAAPTVGRSYLALSASADAQAVAAQVSDALVDPPLRGWREQVRERQSVTEQLDREAFTIDDQSQKVRQGADALQVQQTAAQAALFAARERLARIEQEAVGLADQLSATTAQIRAISGDADPSELLTQTQAELDALQGDVERTRLAAEAAQATKLQLVTEVASLRSRLEQIVSQLAEQQGSLEAGLASAGFIDAGGARAALMGEADQDELAELIQAYERECAANDATAARVRGLIAGRIFAEDEYQALVEQANALAAERARLQDQAAIAQREVDDVRAKRDRWDELIRQSEAAAKRGALAAELVSLLRGKRFVQFLAEEHLRDMALEASQRLGSLTGQRYALELADGSEFVIRDDYSGGQRRPAATLSGGETFLTSLALALALSTKIQLAGQYPLGFFFLDEGFGTLDAEKLELVMSSLEKLRDRDRIVGVISHVQEMRDRLPCYLEVIPTRDDGSGSRVVMRRN
jgi:exonuclease SbcC